MERFACSALLAEKIAWILLASCALGCTENRAAQGSFELLPRAAFLQIEDAASEASVALELRALREGAAIAAVRLTCDCFRYELVKEGSPCSLGTKWRRGENGNLIIRTRPEREVSGKDYTVLVMLENGEQLNAMLHVNRVGVFENGNIIDVGTLAPATSSIRLPVSFRRKIQDPILTSADASPLLLDGSFVRGASDALSTDYELHARVTITDPAKRGPFKIAATVMSNADEQRHPVEIVGRIEHGIWSARDSSRGIPLGTRCRGRAVPIEVEIGSSGVDDEFLISSVAIERAGPSSYTIGDMPNTGLTLAPQSTLKIPLHIIPTNSGLICGIVELRGRFLLGSNEDKVLRIPFAGIAD